MRKEEEKGLLRKKKKNANCAKGEGNLLNRVQEKPMLDENPLIWGGGGTGAERTAGKNFPQMDFTRSDLHSKNSAFSQGGRPARTSFKGKTRGEVPQKTTFNDKERKRSLS